MDIQLASRRVHWMGSSLRVLRDMPEEVRDEMGFSLYQAQLGGRPANALAMQGFGGANVLEIKADFDGDTVRFAEAVYVLHAFQKKSDRGSKTTKRDIQLIKDRLAGAEEHYKATYGV